MIVSLAVSVDREEYSRYERERSTVRATVRVTGQNTAGDQVLVELRRFRRDRGTRTLVLATETVTLAGDQQRDYSVEFRLPEINHPAFRVNRVRRGDYFVRASDVTNPATLADSPDFRVVIMTVAYFRGAFLHGTDQRATDTLLVLQQPLSVSGVTVEEVSFKHPQQRICLAYNFVTPRNPSVTSTATEPFALADGQELPVWVDGERRAVTLSAVSFADIGAATAVELAAALAPLDLVAQAVGGTIQLTGGVLALYVEPSPATQAIGLAGARDDVEASRQLAWGGGPSVKLQASRSEYVLFYGQSAHYIRVFVQHDLLPQQTVVEDLLIERKPLDTGFMQDQLDMAINQIEQFVGLGYLEPTVIVSGVEPEDELADDWDAKVDALTYYAPNTNHWINIKFPYRPLIGFERLNARIGSNAVFDVELDWVQPQSTSGFVQLVPYASRKAFNYRGLVWLEASHGTSDIPNFWQFKAVVGLPEPYELIRQTIGMLAAIPVLSIAGQAYRGGYASQSISRDGISESVSYTASAQFGIFSATIKDYRDNTKENLKQIKKHLIGFRWTVG